MARHYHVDIAVVVAGADRKWVDNLLSHFDVPGVDASRQGVAHQISLAGLRHIALTRRLSRDGGMSVSSALESATRLLTTDANHIAIDDMVSLHLDRQRFQHDIEARLEAAVESVVPRRRGRPPSR